MKFKSLSILAVFVFFVSTIASMSEAKLIRLPGNAAGPGMVNLPYTVPDNNGNQWMIYNGGWLQQQGNQPIYSQGAMLLINGGQPQARGNVAKLDAKTGEVVVENLQANGCQITRRILINREENYVRYVDVIKNTQAAEQTINIQLQTNLNYGVNAAQMVADPRKKDQNLAWIAQTGNGRSAVEVFSGKGSKQPMLINWQQGNNVVQANLSVAIAPNKEVAIMHLHSTSATQEAGNTWVNSIKESKMLASVSKDVRKSIVNFSGGQNFIGDTEVLRGELLDVVELRGGDQMKGNLKETSFKLQTFYGPVELPIEKVVGIINAGQFRPRQLIVTSDGQIFGGKLSKETIDLELSSGQITQVPISQISRVGYRKRVGEPEEWNQDIPMVLMRSGDRVAVALPTQPIAVVTRYGPLQLDPTVVSAIAMQNEEHGSHEIFLTDGSKFSGLVTAETFDLSLSAGGSAQAVRFPTSAIARLQFTTKINEHDDTTPTLDLANDDELVGTLTGELKVDTAFDTITVNAAEIRRLAHAKESGPDVQIMLWDQSLISGQLQDQSLNCKLGSGLVMKVPVALLEEYNQPQPQPSAMMIDKIKAVIGDLNAEDWKQRDRAEAQLTSMGPVVVSVLKQMRPGQPPEAQQRIGTILKQLEKQGSTAAQPAPVEGQE